MICTTFRSDFHDGRKNQTKQSTLISSFDALSKWDDPHIRIPIKVDLMKEKKWHFSFYSNRKSCASESPIKVDLNSKETSHVFQGYFIRKVGTLSKNVYFSLSAWVVIITQSKIIAMLPTYLPFKKKNFAQLLLFGRNVSD